MTGPRSNQTCTIVKFTPRGTARPDAAWSQGDNAETLQSLPGAIAAVRSALTAVEGLYQASESDSDAERRYQQAAEQLEVALADLEWTPPEDDPS
jgi:hypothetical protein